MFAHPLTISLPTAPIGDVIADCQRRRSATWTSSLTIFEVSHLRNFCCALGVFNFNKSGLGYSFNVIFESKTVKLRF